MHNRPRHQNLSLKSKKQLQKRIDKYKRLEAKVLRKRLAKEYSEESLVICTTILEENPDFYTMWNFRREILLDMLQKRPEDQHKRLCADEMDVSLRALKKNPKSYNAWHHRTWIVDLGHADLENELALCTTYLRLDSRNFHCWDYRRFVVSKSNTPPEDELAFTTKKIHENFSNYSSWHNRSALLPKVYSQADLAKELDKDFDLVAQAFYTEPDDQSAWLYHRWLLALNSSLCESAESKNEQQHIQVLQREYQMCQDLLEEEPDCKWAIATRAFLSRDLHKLKLMPSSECQDILENALKRLIQLDPKRHRYYSDFWTKLLSEVN